MTGKVITRPSFPPAAAGLIAARLLNRHSAYEIGQAIDILLDVLDLMDGDHEDKPDFTARPDGLTGDPADAEPDDDAKGDQGWIEWHTMRGSQKGGPNILAGQEDDEEDDMAEEDDPGGGNVDDEPQMVDYIDERPIYRIDQTSQPINIVTAFQRIQLKAQLADFVRCGLAGQAAAIRRKLVALDQREAAMVAIEARREHRNGN